MAVIGNVEGVPERLLAAFAGSYRIEQELGVGGTATVYLAEDLKHHRRVALKVLKPEVAAALGPERFEDEIQIAARLHHPHILGVFDSGVSDGFLYYVMPFVEGHSLRERLQQSEPVSFPYVARVMAEVADALAHAHAAGIVHRDIKPENILLAGKHVVVTDFGIAKAISDATERKSSTSLGMALGTPAYMAPEQAAADPNLDHRADLYALGVVGYEMLAGRTPFTGTSQQMLAAHLSTPPPPVATLRPGVPPALASVVMRALAKDPNDRFASADAMQAQLEPLRAASTSSNSGFVPTIAMNAGRASAPRRIGVAVAAVAALAIAGMWAWKRQPPAAGPVAASAIAPAVPRAAADPNAIPDLATDRSIAVLPFENMSGDKEQSYFSDGIAEELLNLLAKIPELRVIARTSSFQFKGQEIGIQEIARKLHVAAVLEGSVRKSGDTVRITAQLVRASDGSHLWSETYDRKLDDVFKVQDEIAANVVDKLKLTLLGGAPKVSLVDPQAYPLLLQADSLLSAGSKASRVEAVRLYKQVLAQSPREARAWIGLARTYLNQMSAVEVSRAQGVPLVREAAAKALVLDPKAGVVHTYLARLASDEGDLAGAAAAYERAIAISPDSQAVMANTGSLLTKLGRQEENNRIRRWIVRVDPANPTAHAGVCASEAMLGRHEQAIAACRAVLAWSPDYNFIHTLIAQQLLLLGRGEEALKEIALESDESSRLTLEAEALFSLGRKQASDAALEKLTANYATAYPFGIAQAHAHRGEVDAAFQWLERARATGDSEALSAHLDPFLESLHRDARWLPYLRSVGVAPEQLAKIRFKVKLPV